VSAIERQIVGRLAESAGREPQELEGELRSADRDLPVEQAEIRPILGILSQDFGVPLAYDGMLEARLNYVRDLAILIQRRVLASVDAEMRGDSAEQPIRAASGSSRIAARRRSHAPVARRRA
jgi:hypothetical protein